jgi:hypothetical protein
LNEEELVVEAEALSQARLANERRLHEAEALRLTAEAVGRFGVD